MRWSVLFVAAMLALCCGCTDTGTKEEKNTTFHPSYTVLENGTLLLEPGDPDVHEEILEDSDTIKVSRLTFHTLKGDVYAILAAPKDPKASVVYVPGAGVPASGHIPRAKEYAANGFAFLVTDVRGNGGDTPGYPLNIETDFESYFSGDWPQFYLIVSDLIQAKKYLTERYKKPVYVVGSSNGGRYACIAAAADPGFSGLFVISSSGFDKVGEIYSEPARKFLLSIDPDACISAIEAPIMIFHAQKDSVIPFSDGKRLFENTGENAEFSEFSGSHGINSEVDRKILCWFEENL